MTKPFDPKELRDAAQKAIATRASLLGSGYTQGSVAETMDAHRAFRDLLTPEVALAVLDRLEMVESALRKPDRLLHEHLDAHSKAEASKVPPTDWDDIRTIAFKVREIISQGGHPEIPLADLQPHTKVADLYWSGSYDSLAFVEAILAMEEMFSIDIPDMDSAVLERESEGHTLQYVVEYIENAVRNRQGSP